MSSRQSGSLFRNDWGCRPLRLSSIISCFLGEDTRECEPLTGSLSSITSPSQNSRMTTPGTTTLSPFCESKLLPDDLSPQNDTVTTTLCLLDDSA